MTTKHTYPQRSGIDYAPLSLTYGQLQQLEQSLTRFGLKREDDYRIEGGNACFVFDEETAFDIEDALPPGFALSWVPDPATWGGTALAFIVHSA